MTRPLNRDQLLRRCDPSRRGFTTSDELQSLDDIVGQERARLQRVPAADLPAAMQAALAHGATALIRPRHPGGEAGTRAGFSPAGPACLLLLSPQATDHAP